MVVGIIIGVIVVLVVLYVIVAYNGIVKKSMTVDEAFATMDVYLKKRFDLIPNLVETVKGYVGHEQETLSKIVKLRNTGYSGMSAEERVENGVAISRELPKVFALAESYPELKANTSFLELSSQLKAVEEDIANSRKYYNGAVKIYNIAVRTVPSNIIASMFHFGVKPMFEVSNEKERENVTVKF